MWGFNLFAGVFCLLAAFYFHYKKANGWASAEFILACINFFLMGWNLGS